MARIRGELTRFIGVVLGLYGDMCDIGVGALSIRIA